MHLVKHSLFPYLPHQPFEYSVGNGAEGAVFEGDIGAFEEYVFVGIGKAAAIARAVLVNAAGIVGAKKRTGAAFHHIVAVFVEAEVVFDEHTFAQSQHLADTFDVGRFEAGRVVFAASRTAQAIDLRHCLGMSVGQGLEEAPFIGPLQQPLVPFLLLKCTLLPIAGK